jgi:hypothetical protein
VARIHAGRQPGDDLRRGVDAGLGQRVEVAPATGGRRAARGDPARNRFARAASTPSSSGEPGPAKTEPASTIGTGPTTTSKPTRQATTRA